LTRIRAVRSVEDVPNNNVLEIALALWPVVRDGNPPPDPTQLDVLLDSQGQPGAAGYDCGLRTTFAAFAPDEEARVTLPSGEQTESDEEARFVAHLVVTRTLLAAGLAIDERVNQGLATAHALSWTTEGAEHHHWTPLALAVGLWLVALDPQTDSDRPLPIDWSPACFERDWWDPDYRLFSHYDVLERALDWASYVSRDAARRGGCSVWTIAEPLLRLEQDARARIALPMLADGDPPGHRPPATAGLERGRVALLVQGYLQAARPGDADGSIRPAAHH
jgi:hypothetical protein